MKIQKLFLKRFGPFTGKRLDLDTNGAGFHLVYGRNEAGKSSSLRAVIGLLFGIPANTGDAHLHPANTLQVGAELVGQDGQVHTVFRRKGNGVTLQDEQGGKLDEEILTNLKGGLTRSNFEMLFGFGHQQMVDGGCLLQEQGGDAGQSLFAAGSGAFKLNKVISDLMQECDDLFKKNGSKPKVNAAVNRYKEQKAEMIRAALSADDWARLEAQMNDVQTALAVLNNDIYVLHQQKIQLQRIQQTAPLIGDRAVTLEELALLGNVEVLPDGMRAAFRKALDGMETCRQMQTAHQQNIDDARQKRQTLAVPEHILQQATAIDAASQGLSLYEARLQEIPVLRSQVNSLRHEIREQSLSAGFDDMAGDAALESMRLPLVEAERIRQLIALDTELGFLRKNLEEQLGKLRTELAVVERDLAVIPAGDDTSALQAAHDVAIPQVLLESRGREMQAHCEKLQQQVKLAIARLAGFVGTAAELEQLLVPGPETIKQFEARFTALEKESLQLQGLLADLEANEHRNADALLALSTKGHVPTEAELQQARAQRNAVWGQVKSDMRGGVDTVALEVQATEFEKWMFAADNVGDQLRWDAQRVAEHATLSDEKERLIATRTQLQERLDGLQGLQQALQAEWLRQWQGAGIEPLSPAEMRDWHGQYTGALGYCEQLRSAQVELAAVQANLERFRKAVMQHLPDHHGLGNDSTLDHVCNRAKAILDAAAQIRVRREQLAEAADKLRRQLADLEAQEHGLTAKRQAWEAAWLPAIVPLKLDANTPVSAVQHVLDALHDIGVKRSQLVKMKEDLASAEARATAFEENVRQLIDVLAPELATKSLPVGLAAVKSSLENARKNAAKAQVLADAIDTAEAKLKATLLELEQWQGRLARLLQQAGCANVEAMEAALNSSDHKRQAQKALEDIERSIRHAGDGLRLETLLDEVDRTDTGTLEYKLTEVMRTVEDKELERSNLNREIGRLQTELKHLEDGQGAGEAAEKAQHELADVREYAERFMLARLSQILLKRAIEDYRQQNQAAIIVRASEIFRALTLGSFKGIETAEGANSEMVLVGVRPTGSAVGVDGMSSGTRDQMFLSLRLASMERQLLGSEPLPLVIDDLLVHFDDERATAALKVLAELSQKTQVLFFTHHERLVELAQKNVPAGQLALHDLARLPEAV